MLYEGNRLDLEATGLGAGNFPSEPWLTKIKDTIVPAVVPGYANIYSYKFEYQVLGTRWKRGFIIMKATGAVAIPVMFVGLPSSNGFPGGNGAYDLINWQTTGLPNSQHHWPVQLVNDHNVIGVVIDAPGFGAYQYPGGFAPTAMDSLIDDICGINAARWIIANTPHFRLGDVASTPRGWSSDIIPSIYIGGLSWGGCRTTWLATALKDCTGAYAAGAHMSKANFYNNPAMQPSFDPPEWGPSFDYDDMIKASRASHYRIAYGGLSDTGLGPYTYYNLDVNGNPDPAYGANPYLDPNYTGPDCAAILDGIRAHDPSRFSKHLGYSGHTIDLANLKSHFSSWLNGTMRFRVPELPQ